MNRLSHEGTSRSLKRIFLSTSVLFIAAAALDFYSSVQNRENDREGQYLYDRNRERIKRESGDFPYDDYAKGKAEKDETEETAMSDEEKDAKQ